MQKPPALCGESSRPTPREVLGKYGKPDVGPIDGLSPAISIDQRTNQGKKPRSTVGTATETNDYLRLLYARGRLIVSMGIRTCFSGLEQIVDQV